MLRKIDVLMLIVLLSVVGASQAAFNPVFEYSFPASYAGSGQTVTDLSSAGNDATLKNANTSLLDVRPSGFASSLMSINGVNRGKLDTLSLLDSQTVATAGGFTMDVWLKWDGVSGHQKAITYGNADQIKTYNSDLYFMLGSGSGGQIKVASITANQWYHVVAVFDTLGHAATEDPLYPGYYQVIGEMSLYVDDTLVDTKSATKTSMGDRNGILAFGSNTSLTVELWGGAMFNPITYLGLPGSSSSVSPVSPSNGVDNVLIDDVPTLQWLSATDPAIIEHVLYFSTDENWVTNALPTDSSAIVLPVATETYQHSESLAYGTEYFWRVDEAIGDLSNPDNVETGPVWSFVTAYPEVDAGDDVVAWLVDGSTVVTTDPSESDEWPDPVTYQWDLIAGEQSAVTITDPAVLNAEVTIAAAGQYELQLTLNGDANLTGSVVIDVYTDACEAAKGTGVPLLLGDFDQNCIVNLVDFAVLADAWLD